MTEMTLILCATSTALIAGLFYAYSCSVNIGLARLPDNEYLAAMQAINSAIQNPLFFMSFMGALILLPLCTWLNYDGLLPNRFWLLLAASIIYWVGVFGVTVLGNVPLNDALAGFDIRAADMNGIAQQRIAFEQPWLLLHNIRTIASVVCLLLVLISLRCDLKQTIV